MFDQTLRVSCILQMAEALGPLGVLGAIPKTSFIRIDFRWGVSEFPPRLRIPASYFPDWLKTCATVSSPNLTGENDGTTKSRKSDSQNS